MAVAKRPGQHLHIYSNVSEIVTWQVRGSINHKLQMTEVKS